MTTPLARTLAVVRRACTRTSATIAVLSLLGVAVLGVAGATSGTPEPAPTGALGRPVADTSEPAATDPEHTPEDAAAPTASPHAEPTASGPEASVPELPPGQPTEATEAAEPPAPTPGPEPDRIALAPPPPGGEAFAGLSTWIDVYDVEWTPQQQVDVAAAAGVDTLFVQSARHLSEHDIDDAARLGALLDAADAAGLRVMTWYIADFVDPERDLRRAKAGIAFTSPNGNRADAFGLDIELHDEPDVAVRNARLLDLSAQLREWAGPDYPMAAIVLPPLQLDLNGTWWPGFPYAELRPYFDVFIPMSYSSYRGTDAETTHRWNLENVRELRRRVGDPDLPVHLAGGIADNMPEVAAFVAAARDGHVVGAGLYDLHTTRASAWPALQALRRTPGTAGPVPSLLPD